MTVQRSIRVHEVAIDGLPPRDPDPRYRDMIGRVAFIFDGCIVSGWPLYTDPDDPNTPYTGRWETNDDVGRHGEFSGVTHWVEFDVPVWELTGSVSS